MRYLTKSRFRLALECVTKLYYTKKNDYADESFDDPFLSALAEGGFQVGELAKFMFCENPVKDNITVAASNNEEALNETTERLKKNDAVIAEAAFSFNSLLVRSDIIEKRGNIINLYEVKSKSTDGDDDDDFVTTNNTRIKTKWIPDLYDIAFQKYVIANSIADRNFVVIANLILVDKSKVATVDGLNQKFRIIKIDNQTRIETEPDLVLDDFGEPILKIINVDDEIDRILNEFPVPTDYRENIGFKEFVEECERIYSKDERVFTPLGKKCKKCQFKNWNFPNDPAKKSGLHECWEEKTRLGKKLFEESLVIDLWGGKYLVGKSITQELIDKGRYLISQLSEQDIPKSKSADIGLSPYQRRMEQINRVKNKITESYFDKKTFEEIKQNWEYPLHMIDFETSQPALPFHKNMHPYEGIAFQFSHHTLDKDGTVRHAGQYLSFERGVFPNYEFVRQLKSQLEKDKGTIFRYHNHENTYLNKIYDQLRSDPEPPDDKESLCGFIKEITSKIIDKKKEEGPRNMVDLWDLVLKLYYSPYAKGSNSIKQILPAIINESEYLKEKYGKPVYGRNKEIPSLNFDEHIWIVPEKDNNPYETLDGLFDDYSDEDLDKLNESIGEFDEIKDGGAAMTAYNLLQFSHVPDDQRERLKIGLLKYCELDTMAMIMILEDWINR